MDSRRRAGLVSAVVALGVTGAVGVVPAESAERAAPSVYVRHQRSWTGRSGLQKAVDHRGFVVAENARASSTRVFKDSRQRVIVRRAAACRVWPLDADHVYAVLGGAERGPGCPRPVHVRRERRAADELTEGAATKVDRGPAEVRAGAQPGRPGAVRRRQAGRRTVQPVQHDDEPGWGLLVADGGANDVLKVNPRTGKVSTFFAPPTVKDVKACQAPGRERQPGHGRAATRSRPVSTSSGARSTSAPWAPRLPGAGRVYKLSPRTGKVLRVWKGLTAPTGVAVRARRHDLRLRGPRGRACRVTRRPGFDPSTVGRITKISHGKRTYAQVTMPTGLDLKNGDALRLGVEHRQLPRHPARRPGREGAGARVPLTARNDEGPSSLRRGPFAPRGVNDGT